MRFRVDLDFYLSQCDFSKSNLHFLSGSHAPRLMVLLKQVSANMKGKFPPKPVKVATTSNC